jgi:hypothetical protein
VYGELVGSRAWRATKLPLASANVAQRKERLAVHTACDALARRCGRDGRRERAGKHNHKSSTRRDNNRTKSRMRVHETMQRNRDCG